MKKPTISLVIPTYTLNEELEDLAGTCAASYEEHVDELIITEDGGNYSQELKDRADIYIYSKKNAGFTKNVNRGWKLATGDFVMIVNSDTQLYVGKLEELCIPGKVTSPRMQHDEVHQFWGSFFCVPRDVALSRGMLDERMKMYYSDNEFYDRVKDIFQYVETVRVIHDRMQTIKLAGGQEHVDDDKKAYENIPKRRK